MWRVLGKKVDLLNSKPLSSLIFPHRRIGQEKFVEEVRFDGRMNGFEREFEGKKLTGDAFEALGSFTLEEFSRVSDFVEGRDRRCELQAGKVMIKELVSPYHEGAMEAFRYVFQGIPDFFLIRFSSVFYSIFNNDLRISPHSSKFFLPIFCFLYKSSTRY
jgi:hypothetical protein